MNTLRDKLAARFKNVARSTEPTPLKTTPLQGRFEHFKTEQDRQAHLKYLEDNKQILPF